MKSQTPTIIKEQIDGFISRQSRFLPRRDYLSMSHLSDCPRRIVIDFLNGFAVEEHTHRMCYAGYEQEENVKQILRGIGKIDLEDVEVVAPFDARLRGHMDGLWNGNVMEIKSVSSRQWEKLIEKNKSIWKHYAQVQLYMHYSGCKKAYIIYRNRETYEHIVFEANYDATISLRMENKARAILHAIDNSFLPVCECGYCKE